MNIIRYCSFIAILYSFSSRALAVPSAEQIASTIVTSDDPMIISTQINQAQKLSCDNLYPGLADINSIPLYGSNTGRMKIPSSDIIPTLSPALLSSSTSVSSMIHADNLAVPDEELS